VKGPAATRAAEQAQEDDRGSPRDHPHGPRDPERILSRHLRDGEHGGEIPEEHEDRDEAPPSVVAPRGVLRPGRGHRRRDYRTVVDAAPASNAAFTSGLASAMIVKTPSAVPNGRNAAAARRVLVHAAKQRAGVVHAEGTTFGGSNHADVAPALAGGGTRPPADLASLMGSDDAREGLLSFSGGRRGSGVMVQGSARVILRGSIGVWDTRGCSGQVS
jgi:hypothetical protein